MTEPLQPATSSRHAAHDRTWIAALAARDPDLSPSELAQARAQLAGCTDCTDLLADLVALAAAIPTATTPARPRDFTLTTADTVRLKARGWRRFLGFIGSPRDGFSRPLALGFTTLGLAGLLVATVPSIFSGGTAGGARILSTVGSSVEGAQPAPGLGAAPAAAESMDLLAPSAAPQVTKTGDGGVFAGGNPDDATASDDQRDTAAAAMEAGSSDGENRSGLSALILAAGTLLIVGVGLFGLRWRARHLG